MLKLCGFAASNYYNKVKFVLLEKGVAFEEKLVYPSRDEALLRRSPLGKIPFIETHAGTLCESQTIVEFIERAYPEPPLYPADPFAAAKCRELIQFMEAHVELVARRLYREAYFDGKVSDEIKQEVAADLEKNVKAFGRLIKFAPYIAGAEFTFADCAAYAHFDAIGPATQRIYGNDCLDSIDGVRPYLALIAERPQAQRLARDREQAMEALMKHVKRA